MKRKFSRQLRRQRRCSALASQTLSRVGFCIDTNAMRSSNNTSNASVCVCECIAAAAAACCSSLYYLPTELAQTSSAPHQKAGSIEHLLCMHSVVLRGLSSSPMNLLLSLMTNMKKQNQQYMPAVLI